MNSGPSWPVAGTRPDVRNERMEDVQHRHRVVRLPGCPSRCAAAKCRHWRTPLSTIAGPRPDTVNAHAHAADRRDRLGLARPPVRAVAAVCRRVHRDRRAQQRDRCERDSYRLREPIATWRRRPPMSYGTFTLSSAPGIRAPAAREGAVVAPRAGEGRVQGTVGDRDRHGLAFDVPPVRERLGREAGEHGRRERVGRRVITDQLQSVDLKPDGSRFARAARGRIRLAKPAELVSPLMFLSSAPTRLPSMLQRPTKRSSRLSAGSGCGCCGLSDTMPSSRCRQH